MQLLITKYTVIVNQLRHKLCLLQGPRYVPPDVLMTSLGQFVCDNRENLFYRQTVATIHNSPPSVSDIVSRLGAGGFEFRFPVGAGNFSFPKCHIHNAVGILSSGVKFGIVLNFPVTSI